MHIEITGRMTGKTERLIATANQLIAKGKKVVIVYPCGARQADFKKCCPGAKVISDKAMKESKWFEELDNDQDAIWMFDEFDWFDNQSIIKIRPNGYYYTTPRPGFDLMNASGDRVINQLLAKAETFVDTVVVMPCNNVLRDEGMDFWGIDYVA
ncbi:hypothetical protein [Aeromonas sp. 30P]|uniref:hypothetical protein n=1 Tax=Aeromonas sp. 30P TaxID=3452717 RepID=UPI003F7A0923